MFETTQLSALKLKETLDVLRGQDAEDFTGRTEFHRMSAQQRYLKRPMDIVVDTNVLVAGLRSRNGASNALLHKIRDRKEFVLHLSTAAVLEYEEVLVRELVPFK